MKKAAVIIPIYKKEPTSTEITSIEQTTNVLKNFAIFFVCPNSLDTTKYERFKAEFEKFDDKYFKNLRSYSILMLKKEFYERFSNFEFVLICQPDAYVFEDKLDYWCDKGFDCIGAPWFEGFNNATENSKMLDFVGNGGFSLRKTKSMLQISTPEIFRKTFREIFEENTKKKLISNILQIPKILFFYAVQFVNPTIFNKSIYEDWLIATKAQKLMPEFKFPSATEAAKFSFEQFPEKLYEQTGGELPFGCHAFAKYNPEFWRKFIDF